MNETQIKDTLKAEVSNKKTTKLYDEYKYLLAFARKMNDEIPIYRSSFFNKENVDKCIKELRDENSDKRLKKWFLDNPDFNRVSFWEHMLSSYIYNNYPYESWFKLHGFYKYLYGYLNESKDNYIDSPIKLFNCLAKSYEFTFLFKDKK